MKRGDREEREGEREREREQALLTLRATSPHTVGYIGACDQEEGVIECTKGEEAGPVSSGDVARHVYHQRYPDDVSRALSPLAGGDRALSPPAAFGMLPGCG